MTDGVLSTTALSVDHGQTFRRDQEQGLCGSIYDCWSSGAGCWAPSTTSTDSVIVRGARFIGNTHGSTFAVNASEFTICSLYGFLAEPLVGNNSVIQEYNAPSGREP
jgi:hypothetical protein